MKNLFTVIFTCLLFCGGILNAQWKQIGSDIDGEAYFDLSGHSISLSSDGTRVAIGAHGNNGNGTDSGHARVYEEIGGNWVQIGGDIDGEAAGDQSGLGVSLSGDGKRIAIGAHLNSGNGIFSGSVRVYEYIGSSWVQIGGDLDGEAMYNWSGWSVPLSYDGSRLAIGAHGNDGNGSGSGHVRIFDEIGGNWVQVGSDIDGENAGDNAGFSTSFSNDGTRIAIGSHFNDGNGSLSGHVRIFDEIGGNWVQVGNNIEGEAALDEFGAAVSLSGDGSRVIVGAYRNDGNGLNSGHARIFEEIGGNWIQIGSDLDGEAAGDNFGISVSISDDGTQIAVGGSFNEGNGEKAGHVRMFKEVSGNWVQIGTDIDAEDEKNQFGQSVSLSASGHRLAVGAPYNDSSNGGFSGHVRVFEPISPDDIDIGSFTTVTSQSCFNETTVFQTVNLNYPKCDGNGNASFIVNVIPSGQGVTAAVVGTGANDCDFDIEITTTASANPGSYLIGITITDTDGVINNSSLTPVTISQNGTSMLFSLGYFEVAPPLPLFVSSSLPTLNVDGCNINDAPPAYSTVAQLEAAGVTITDLCTLTVTYSDVSSGTCPIVITRTYIIFDWMTGQSVWTSQTINIDDLKPPSEVCNNILVPLDQNGIYTLKPNDLNVIGAGSSDNCSAPLNFTVDKMTFDCNELGPNPVTLTVTDDCGNFNTCMATVFVKDQLKPFFTNCPTYPTPISTDLGHCFATINFTVPTADDNCSVTQLKAKIFDAITNQVVKNWTNNPDGQYPVGNYKIKWRAKDANGNKKFCTTNFDVLDLEQPTPVCEPSFSVTLVNGQGSIILSNIDAGSTDNCTIATSLLSQYNFTCADRGTVNVTLTVIDDSGNSNQCVTPVEIKGTSLSINHLTLSEGTGNGYTFYFFKVERAAGGCPVSVDYSTGNGTATLADNDYQYASGTHYWPPGGSNIRYTIVRVVRDGKTEPDEHFWVALTNPSPGVNFTENLGKATILNDDAGSLIGNNDQNTLGPKTIESLSQSNKVELFPNPVSRKLNIEVPESWFELGDLEIDIFDDLGRKISAFKMLESQIEIEVMALPIGTYFLVFQTRLETVLDVQKVVVKR